MATYRMDDGTVLKTENAIESWMEDTCWNGNNHISVVTGSQWHHQTLYKSRKGRYYVVHISDWQGSTPHAEWVSQEEATRWLLTCEHDLPDDLKKYQNEIEE